MDQFQHDMHEFVQASHRLTHHVETTKITEASMRRQDELEQALAVAGDRLESVMRRMMREEAERPEWENG